jgi:NodT family efflux transporter outer membrane factor (OMF) lipoprotein
VASTAPPLSFNPPRSAVFSKLAAIASASIILCGCAAAGSDFHDPNVNLPSSYGAKLIQSPSSFKTAATWQSLFKDPTLNKLIGSALSSSLDLEAARARIEQSRAIAAQTGLKLTPSVSNSGSASINKDSRQATSSPDTASGDSYSLFAGELSASWELDFFGGNRRAKAAAVADLASVEADAAATRLALVADIATNYVKLRSAQQRLGLAQTSVRLNRSILKTVEEKFSAGEASNLDISRSKAQLAEFRANVPAREIEVTEYRNQLTKLLALVPGRLNAQLRDPTQVPRAREIPSLGLPSDLLRRRPDIIASERELAAASERIGQSISEYYPKFSLTGSLGVQARDLSEIASNGSTFFSGGPELQWRILDFKRIDAEVAEAKGKQREKLADYRAAIISALEEVETGIVRSRQAGAEEKARSEALAARTRVRAGELTRYQVGDVDVTNVLDADRDVNTAAENLTQIQETKALYAIALFKALGGDWAIQAHSAQRIARSR